MKKMLKISSFLIFIVMVAQAVPASAEVGKFASLEGNVDILRPGQTESAAAATDGIVGAGDIIRTKSLSKAEIRFSDNTILRLGESSRVEVRRYDIENGKRADASIFLERGSLRAIVSRSGGKNDLNIETPHASAAVKGTDLFVAYQRAVTAVLVVDGKVSVVNRGFPDKPVEVTSGNTLIVPADGPPNPQRTYLSLEKERYAEATGSAPKRVVLAEKKEGQASEAEGYTAPGEMKATVVKVLGSAQVRSRGSITWHDAKESEILYAGDTIETKKNGKIEIKLDNGNVIDLKPDSQLVLQKLTEDPKTGEYENLFQSNHGTLRAKVGKLKGDSKFEVKTPTAVGAVRGTIMYLQILPSLTVAYFEEGNGYLRSLISNVFKVVPAGGCASIDDKGNINENYDSGELKYDWNIDTGAEGYSPPGGGAGGTGDELLDFYLLANNQFNEPFEKPLNPGSTEEGGGEGDTSPSFVQTFTGKWGDGNPTHYYRSGRFIREAGFEKGLIGSTAQQWWNGSPFEFVASGEYLDFADSEPYLWQTPLLSFNSVTNNQKTEDGGAFFGRTTGIWNAGAMKNGKVRAIYLSPTAIQNVYDAGILKGAVSGAYQQVPNPGSEQEMGVWVADGILTASLMAQGIAIQPSSFNDLSGIIGTRSFIGVGYGTKGEESMLGAVAGNTYNLTGQNWGIWQTSSLVGSAPNNSSPSWRLASGGTIKEGSSIYGYFLATLVGSNWSDGELAGAFRGVTLRQNESANMVIGSMTGDAVGTYVDTTWHARGVGEWVELAQLSTGEGGVNFDSAALAQLVSVPITETYSSLLTGSGTLGASGTITNAQMDISFYASAANALSGIWAALINANYTNPGGGATVGSVTLSDNAGTTANLTNLQWNNNNTWVGNVDGSASNNAVFQGQAGGTYTGTESGTLAGAGAGTWGLPQ